MRTKTQRSIIEFRAELVGNRVSLIKHGNVISGKHGNYVGHFRFSTRRALSNLALPGARTE